MAIYLDYNATTPVDERVLDVMIDVYRNHFGNADSRTHNHGDQARTIVEKARAQVASLLDIDSTEGEGTTVTITIPVEKEQPEEEQTEEEE